MKDKRVCFEISTRQAEALLSFLRRALNENVKVSGDPREAIWLESAIRVLVRAVMKAGSKEKSASG